MMFGFTVLFPLTFVSSALVPTETMPGWLQTWVVDQPGDAAGRRLRGLLVGGPWPSRR